MDGWRQWHLLNVRTSHGADVLFNWRWPAAATAGSQQQACSVSLHTLSMRTTIIVSDINQADHLYFNPLDSKGNYSATSNNTKSVHWPLMGGLLHLAQQGGDWAAGAPPSPLIAVLNVTAYPSTASVPITVLLYDGPLLCGFNVAIEGLKSTTPSVSNKSLNARRWTNFCFPSLWLGVQHCCWRCKQSPVKRWKSCVTVGS